MILVISSPSKSTIGFSTLILFTKVTLILEIKYNQNILLAGIVDLLKALARSLCILYNHPAIPGT